MTTTAPAPPAVDTAHRGEGHRGQPLSRRDRRSLWGMGGFILLLHVVGWGVLLGLVAPANYRVGGQLVGVGLGVTAYTLGMRHAFDADHIAAIDNTTHRHRATAKPPLE